MNVSGAEVERYKVIRTDSLADIPGTLISADDQTGIVTLKEGDKTVTHNFGIHAIRIVLKRR